MICIIICIIVLLLLGFSVIWIHRIIVINNHINLIISVLSRNDFPEARWSEPDSDRSESRPRVVRVPEADFLGLSIITIKY